jgi:tetratricopeptide (TPR) repeat protein
MRHLRMAGWALGLSALLTSAPTPATATDPGEAIQRANQALRELRIDEAERALASARPGPDRDFVRGILHFHRGDYAAAQGALQASMEALPPVADDDRLGFRNLIRETHEATRNFVEVRSPDGRHVVRHAPGPDEVLVPYAIEALRRADEALGRHLGMRVPGPILIEVYPTPATLAQVSTLTEEAIHRTGTIALCKWNRLMITSPRALVRGYPWMDTISHELVHLVLSRASRDKAPVWFQEGMAKFLERTWRGDPPRAHLDPGSAALLSTAVKEGQLIPFQKLHPSIALLPSQRDAALAFAQVATFFETFHAHHGSDGLRDAVEHIAQGVDARGALAKVAKSSFAALEARWKRDLMERASPIDDPPPVQEVRFRKGEHMDESLEVEAERARKFLRLGDLLWDRGRPGAAKVEYAKAHRAAPDHPIVASRLARAALAAGDASSAIEAIDTVIERHPDHAPAHAVRGSALLAQGNLTAAAEASREAIRLNPFDPRPHCDLASASEDDEERRREETACRRLDGAVGP